ncbi:MAG: hypothetical protein JO192_06640, partial [Candidatus Eremiobacteraeota bacterium]|nr:hypothetical protein [Candidatus Eremiobacteraeota bacterium]
AATGQQNGQNGGSIEIGSEDAVHEADSVAEGAKEDWHAFPPFQVTIAARLAAGYGGRGNDDPSGTFANGTQTFSAGNGGNGGDFELQAGNVMQFGPGNQHVLIRAGNGGDGGTAGAAWNITAANGTAIEPNAIDIDVQEGGGGRGGDIDVDADKNANKGFQDAGGGGFPGGVLSTAGHGWSWSVNSDAALAVGKGGSFTLTLGFPGFAGTGSNHPTTPPPDGQYPAITFYDGAGGAGDGYYQPGTAGLSGGVGGSLTLLPPPGITGTDFATRGKLKVTVSGFGNGGAGGNGSCSSPTQAGGSGGNAGNLHDNGLMAFITIVTTPGYTSFGGGNGAKGNPPGTGGTAGKNDEGTTVGAAGTAGSSC